jgi:amino acid transporter/nucleotide-binding universal stress UspA family protein
MEIGTHRPRNVGWARAAALLYGDWGTSKAYVIGAAFFATQYSSLPIIVAVCALTALVGYNYVIVCRHFPDGGGVYSSARLQSRFLAVLGSLLLLADLTVTASLNGWTAMVYLHVPRELLMLSSMGLIAGVSLMNYFGPKHTGSFAVSLAVPMIIVVVMIVLMSVPHLSTTYLEPSRQEFSKNWTSFVSVILALSGVEAIANLTGVMRLDPGSTMDKPSVAKTATRSILVVGVEVVFGTALLGWAMLSLSPGLKSTLMERWDDMLTVLAEQYGTMAFGPGIGKTFGIVVGIIVGVLLISGVNTVVSAAVGLLYLLARDGEMPKPFTRLNNHGVPWFPLIIAALFPILVVLCTNDQHALMDLYAIGVVGAIVVNLGSCAFNKNLKLLWHERATMVVTFLILFAVEMTLAESKPHALFFIVCILIFGFGLRGIAQKRAGFETITVRREFAEAVKPETLASFRPNFSSGQSILVAARGFTPVLRFALEEAKLREGNLYVVYVKQLSVNLPGPIASKERPRWQDDPDAAQIMYGVTELAQSAGVSAVPVYAVSENPAATILDIAATLGVDMLMLGAPHRSAMSKLLRGDVVNEVAKNLPENIQLLIHS